MSLQPDELGEMEELVELWLDDNSVSELPHVSHKIMCTLCNMYNVYTCTCTCVYTCVGIQYMFTYVYKCTVI